MKAIKLSSLLEKFSVLLFTTFFSSTTLSEVTLDGSMGSSGALAGPDYQITEDLGQRTGGNLFHSFGQFNINSAESATFSGSAGIKNVISRVTGGQASTIDGAFRSTIPGANTYFINPSGVIFGANASLDVQGSFHASTANYLKFKDGVKLETGLANANPILTVANPEAFGFLDNAPAPISVSGGLNQVLKVPEGATLSLVAGDITINDTSLYAPSGQVVLASAGSVGEVVFNETGIKTSSFNKGGNIHLSRSAANPVATINDTMQIADIDVSADAAGKVIIRGGQMVMDNAYIWSDTTNGNGKGIDIGLKGNLTMNGVAEKAGVEKTPQSGITANSLGKGNAGNIVLNIDGLKLTHGTRIDSTATSKSSGDGGDILINANSILLEGNDSKAVPKLTTVTTGTGNAGNITITNMGQLEISKDASIETITGNKGNSGVVLINTGSLDLHDGSTIYNIVVGKSAEGNGGGLTINATDSINLNNAALISNSTGGKGDAGTLTIHAKNNLRVTKGSVINTSPLNESGNGGEVFIKANTIFLSGEEAEKPTGINNSVSGTGNTGHLNITSHKIEILGGATIMTDNVGSGHNGDITLNAKEGSILLSGRNKNLNVRSSIISSTTGTGNSGNLIINAKSLEVKEGSGIFAFTGSNSQAGAIFIDADSIELSEARITTGASMLVNETQRDSSLTGDAGDISIVTQSLDLKNGSWIDSDTSTAGHGGNITIDAKSVFLSGSRPIGEKGLYSIISTNTYSQDNNAGAAGNIILNNVEQLNIQDASINVNSFGAGSGGNQEVNAKSIIISGKNSPKLSGLLAMTSSDKENAGKAGSIVVNSEHIDISDDGLIDLSTTGTGKGGNLNITADSMSLSGKNTPHKTGIVISTKSTESNAGNAGDAKITVGHLNISDAGLIDLSTTGAGKGGNLNITAETMSLSGKGSPYPTGIFISTQSTESNAGDAGDANIITVGHLNISDTARISTSSHGKGDGGNLIIDAQSITLKGDGSNTFTGIGSQANGPSDDKIDYQGNAGDLTLIVEDSLNLHNRAEISASTFELGKAGHLTITANDILLNDSFIVSSSNLSEIDISNNADIAKSGNIVISANKSLTLENNSAITVQTEKANAGGITITGENTLSLNDSKISTSVANGEGQGGNITLNNPLIALDNSQILARAKQGEGGTITAPGFLFQSPNSTIDASSEKNIAGELNLNPVTNISGSMTALPMSLLNASQHLTDRCSSRSGIQTNSFVVKNGGFSRTPTNLIPSDFMEIESLTTPNKKQNNPVMNNIPLTQPSPALVASQQIDCL